MSCCKNCNNLVDRGGWYNRFSCSIDDEDLDSANLKCYVCNLFEEKDNDSEI